MKPRHVQTKLEKWFSRRLAPLGFNYTGDGRIFIGGKVPDFYNKHLKIIIEIFGDYWHSPDDEVNRIQHFAKYGYPCLVIWEHETLNQVKLREKIRSFVDTYKISGKEVMTIVD